MKSDRAIRLLASLAMTLIAVPSVKAEIVVGVNLSLTGPAAALGTSFQRGLEYAPKTIGGESVRYIVLDDGTDPSAAVRNVRKLATDEHADIIFGPTNAPAGYAIAPVLGELKVPLLSATPIDLSGDKAAWFGTTLMSNRTFVSASVKDMVKHGYKRIAYIGYSDTYGDQIYGELMNLAKENGLEVVTNERFARSDTSVTGQVLKIVAAKPDAVMIGASASPAALPNNTLLERNIGKPLYNTPVVVGKDFVRLVKNPKDVIAATFLISAARSLPDSNPTKPISVALIDKFEKVYGPGSADGQVGEAFDAGIVLTHIATEALKVSKPGSQAFREALLSELYKTKDLPGTLGIYTFDKGTPWGLDERSVILLTLENGEWKLKN